MKCYFRCWISVDFGDGLSLDGALLPSLAEDVGQAVANHLTDAECDLSNQHNTSRAWNVDLELGDLEPCDAPAEVADATS